MNAKGESMHFLLHEINYIRVKKYYRFCKGEKDNAKAVFKARKDFMVMKDFFTAGRSSEVKDYPSQVMHKSLVIKTKLQHKTSFMKLKKYIK